MLTFSPLGSWSGIEDRLWHSFVVEREPNRLRRTGSTWGNLRKRQVQGLASSWRWRNAQKISSSSATKESGDLEQVTELRLSAPVAEKGEMEISEGLKHHFKAGGPLFTYVV